MKNRYLIPELMDYPNLDVSEHQRALNGLRRINVISRTSAAIAHRINRYCDSLQLSSARILDLGCGGGDVAFGVAKSMPAHGEWSIEGWDISQTAIDYARQSYENVATTNQKWRDLIGFYTRFGDVRALLGGVDDRYVIMNAGDEMKLAFASPAPPPAGFVRDWVLIGDGWVKDGNFNTTWSKTVLPLPAHSRPIYPTAPGALADDPVYRQHKADWQTYHTRYVTPRGFAETLCLRGERLP